MAKDKFSDPTAAFEAWMKGASSLWGNAFTGAKTFDNEDALETIKSLQADFVAFVERRLEKDMATIGRLAAAKSPAEAGQIQLDYLQDLVVDYNRQAMAAATASGKAMMGAFSRMQSGR
jgi:hypothetical protein